MTAEWKDVVTIGLGAVGAALGVMNTWNSLTQRRVRLIVRPTYAFPAGGAGMPMVSISVTNLSTFPLTVSEVGFVGRRGARNGPRSMILHPEVIDGKSWPRRLEPRDALSLYFGIEQIATDPRLLAKAYAKTDCGIYAYGTSPVLSQLRDIAGKLGE